MNTQPPLPQQARCRLPGTVAASVAHTSGREVLGQQQTVSEIPGIEDIVNPAYIGVKGGLTLALPRQFEFVRIDIEVRLPCKDTDADIIATKNRASQYVQQFLQEEQANAFGETDTSQPQPPASPLTL